MTRPSNPPITCVPCSLHSAVFTNQPLSPSAPLTLQPLLRPSNPPSIFYYHTYSLNSLPIHQLLLYHIIVFVLLLHSTLDDNPTDPRTQYPIDPAAPRTFEIS